MKETVNMGKGARKKAMGGRVQDGEGGREGEEEREDKRKGERKEERMKEREIVEEKVKTGVEVK